MTPWPWAALAAALLLLGPVDPVRARLRALAARGRLDALPEPRPGWRVPRRAPGRAGVWLVAVAAGAGVAAAAEVVLAVAAALVVGCCAAAALRARRRRASAVADERVLGALRALAGELTAGSRPAAALRAAAEATPEHAGTLAAAAERAAAGEDASPALAGDPAFEPLAHAWRVAVSTGAALAGVVARVADDAAAARDQARAVAAALAGPRSSAGLLAVLPVLGMVLGAAMGASPLTFLLHRPSGHVVCLAGVVLDVAGVLWTRRLTDRAERC